MCSLGQIAAANGGPLKVKPEHKEAADWMTQNQLATINKSGKLILHSSSLAFGTTLSLTRKRLKNQPTYVNAACGHCGAGSELLDGLMPKQEGLRQLNQRGSTRRTSLLTTMRSCCVASQLARRQDF